MRRLAMFLGSSVLGLVAACVGDAIVVPQPDAGPGVDAASDARPDTATPDTGVDAGPCSNPVLSANIVTTNGGDVPPPLFGLQPAADGDYILTSTAVQCLGGCQTIPSLTTAGGLRITTAGNNVTVERRVDVAQNQPRYALADRLQGTYNQAAFTMTLKQSCGSDSGLADGGTETWIAQFGRPGGSDGGALQLRVQMGLQATTSKATSPVYLYFTKQ